MFLRESQLWNCNEVVLTILVFVWYLSVLLTIFLFVCLVAIVVAYYLSPNLCSDG